MIKVKKHRSEQMDDSNFSMTYKNDGDPTFLLTLAQNSSTREILGHTPLLLGHTVGSLFNKYSCFDCIQAQLDCRRFL